MSTCSCCVSCNHSLSCFLASLPAYCLHRRCNPACTRALAPYGMYCVGIECPSANSCAGVLRRPFLPAALLQALELQALLLIPPSRCVRSRVVWCCCAFGFAACIKWYSIFSSMTSLWSVRLPACEHDRYALSLKCGNGVNHMRIMKGRDGHRVGKLRAFANIGDLVNFYRQTSLHEEFDEVRQAVLLHGAVKAQSVCSEGAVGVQCRCMAQ